MPQVRADIAASFQRVAVAHLAERCARGAAWALEDNLAIRQFVVSGGVAANTQVRFGRTPPPFSALLQLLTRLKAENLCPQPPLPDETNCLALSMRIQAPLALLWSTENESHLQQPVTSPCRRC